MSGKLFARFPGMSIYLIFLFLATSCSGQETTSLQEDDSPVKVIVGAERIEEYLPQLQNKKVGMVVNHTSFVKKMHLVDTLLKLDINITKVFAPEHGFRGAASAGEVIKNEIDQSTGIPILSLYGSKKKPSEMDLKDIDIIIFDIQDVGVRFYTYISTLELVMEAAAENDISVIILDRPNPHLHYIGGPLLDLKYKSFVGQQAVPIVYGLSIGEYGAMLKGEGLFNKASDLNLEIIYCESYTRNTYYELPIPPSPNLPNMTSVMLYPLLCLLEGTDFSEGRGTELPFQQYGHPDYKNKKYHFIPKSLPHAKSPKWGNERCYGVDLSDTDPKEIFMNATFSLKYIIDAYSNSHSADSFFKHAEFFDKLVGNNQVRQDILSGMDENTILSKWKNGLENYNSTRLKYIFYPSS